MCLYFVNSFFAHFISFKVKATFEVKIRETTSEINVLFNLGTKHTDVNHESLVANSFIYITVNISTSCLVIMTVYSFLSDVYYV